MNNAVVISAGGGNTRVQVRAKFRSIREARSLKILPLVESFGTRRAFVAGASERKRFVKVSLLLFGWD